MRSLGAIPGCRIALILHDLRTAYPVCLSEDKRAMAKPPLAKPALTGRRCGSGASAAADPGDRKAAIDANRLSRDET